jgi:hypothetical protein
VLVKEAIEKEEDLLSNGWIRLRHAFQDLVLVVLEGSLKVPGI